MIALLATLKVRAVTINVNYRYVEAELNYLFDNADVVALLFLSAPTPTWSPSARPSTTSSRPWSPSPM